MERYEKPEIEIVTLEQTCVLDVSNYEEYELPEHEIEEQIQ